MPTDRFERGVDSFRELDPSAPSWDEIVSRAEHGSTALMATDPGGRTRSLYVAAAVVVLMVVAVGAVALAGSGGDGAQTVPAGEPAAPDPTATADGPDPTEAGDLPLADLPTICRPTAQVEAGEPSIQPGPGPDSPFPVPADEPERAAVAHGTAGSVGFEIHVPGVVVIDLIGERVEEVALERGAAVLWLTDDFVQVRWFDGGQDLCGSFTVTAMGGTETERRAVAVALADRMVLPAARDITNDVAGEAFAIWPETDSRQVSSEEPPWSSDPVETALVFAQEVLGWDDAAVPDGVGEETAQVPVARTDFGGPVMALAIRVERVVGDRYRVVGVGPVDETDGQYATVSVQGSTVFADAGPSHPDTVTREVQFRYGGVLSVGPAKDYFELEAAPEGAGSVLVLYRDASGEVIGAWGTALPAGDFAAG